MSKLPIVVMISGGGTTLRNLLEYQRRGELDVEFVGVVSNRSQVAGVEIARRTVAKYREAMRIPSSVERRRLMVR